jgi:uncharacterized protein (DUF433 family)
MPVVLLEYIEVDDRGVAKLIGSRIKVMHLVCVQRVNNLSAEQLCAEYPDLAPAQVYAALAYYHANKAAVDRQIEESVRFAEEMRAKHPNRFTRAELEDRWRAKFGTEPPSAPGAAGE